MARIIGIHYLHRHPVMQEKLGVDDDHIIVDKKDWKEVVKALQENPQKIAQE